MGFVLVLSGVPVAGNQNLFELTIICPDTYGFRITFARMIADEFKEAGIDTSVEVLSMDMLVQRCFETEGRLHRQGGFDIALFAWGAIREPTDSEYIYDLFHSENSVSKREGGRNIMSWEDPANDTLISKLRGEQDETLLEEYWLEWQELFHEEQPMAIIYQVYTEDEKGERWQYQHLSFNFNHPHLKKKQVRQALSHLIPRQKICNLHNQNEENQMSNTISRAKPWTFPLTPDFWTLNETVKPYAYDPELAKELLFRAGYDVRTAKHEKAESLLEQAKQAFDNFEFPEALNLATQAQQLYEELGDREAYAEVDSVTVRYQTAAAAQDLLNQGIELKEGGDYETAQQKLEEAKQKFEEVALIQKVTDIEALITEVDELLRKLRITEEADTLFEQGKKAYNEENYEEALEFFTQAKVKYESVGSEKANDCQEWIAKTEEAMNPCLGTFLLVLFIAVGFAILQRRSH